MDCSSLRRASSLASAKTFSSCLLKVPIFLRHGNWGSLMSCVPPANHATYPSERIVENYCPKTKVIWTPNRDINSGRPWNALGVPRSLSRSMSVMAIYQQPPRLVSVPIAGGLNIDSVLPLTFRSQGSGTSSGSSEDGVRASRLEHPMAARQPGSCSPEPAPGALGRIRP